MEKLLTLFLNNKGAKLCFIVLLTFTFSLFPSLCEAQYIKLLDFNGNGEHPFGSLIVSGDTLYGMTEYGGTNDDGEVFSIQTNGSNLTDLFDFNSFNGMNPAGSLILSADTFYGLTLLGGTDNQGLVFSLLKNGSGYMDMNNFIDSNGADPYGNLILSGDTLYGVTALGGATFLDGVIFSIQTNGSGYTILHNFNNNDTDGFHPFGSLIQSGDTLYGMTANGGTDGDGIIFSIRTNGGGYTIMKNFNGTDGNGPRGSLIQSGTTLYGMTSIGGMYSDGVIFSIQTNGSGYLVLHNFNDTAGSQPQGSLIQYGNKLYGMTKFGGVKDSGVIFSIRTNGSRYTDLHDFDDTDGGYPAGSLIMAGSTLYGMTSIGGAHHFGVIFSFFDTAATLEVPELNANEGIKVYPNPNNGKFVIQMVNGKSSMLNDEIQIYNLFGEQVYLKSCQLSAISYQPITIDLSSQPNGVYLYRVISQNGSMVGEGKVVIEK
jgi:uncharacterized repeat protein (TIGR03803 family)